MELRLATLFLLWNVCYGSHDRFKRVINGVTLNGRPTTYTAVRYYGALASSESIVWNYLGAWDYFKPTHTWCSGSLLTPGIFQTACHCIADFNKNNARVFHPPIILHNWEGKGVVYVGISKKFGDDESFEKYNYITTMKFMVHHKCANFGELKAAKYDYGIVQLDASWIKHDDRPPTYPWIEIECAPAYLERQMKDFHLLALRRQLVCMLIGFGQYIRYNPSASDFLRIGWGTLLTKGECIVESAYILFGYNVSFRQNFNWVCTRGFPKHDQESGGGDSGGPFTCDNKYFAVLSGNSFYLDDDGNKINIITRHHALIHTLYTNAIDFRHSFIHAIDEQPIYITRDLEHDSSRFGHSSLKRLRTTPHSRG